MNLHCFICASPLFPSDQKRDEQVHLHYLQQQKQAMEQDVNMRLTIIQNGCRFPTLNVRSIQNPITKNVAYNWLLCDTNCEGDYWMFVPEDCLVTPKGLKEIWRHLDKSPDCFALSRDPKALIGRRGIFNNVSDEIKTLCDMNFLGKEIACVILREELQARGLHCITRKWEKKAKNPDLWGNDLYGGMNMPGHPDSNLALKLPIFQDFGFDGWKATKRELEESFMKIVSAQLEKQRVDADKMKGLIADQGPRISEVPYRGFWAEWRSYLRRSK